MNPDEKRRSYVNDDKQRSLSSSFADGTSKFFSSVIAKKNGLFSDISNKFETTFSKPTGGESETNEDRSPTLSDSSQDHSESKLHGNLTYSDGNGSAERGSRPHNNETIQQYEDKGTRNNGGRVLIPAPQISFDEPLYNGRGTQQLASNNGTVPKQSPLTNNSNMSNVRSSKAISGNAHSNQKLSNEIVNQPHDNTESQGSQNFTDRRAGKLTTLKRRSSTVDEMLFDDYVIPEESYVPNRQAPDGAIADSDAGRELLGDLMSFDDKDSESTGVDNGPIPRDSSVDSSDNEFGGKRYYYNSVDSSDAEFGGVVPFHRTSSMGSEKSWSSTYSVDSQPDELTLECMDFMKGYVDKIFKQSDDVSQTDKAKFGEFCQHMPGRLWFARYVNAQRVHNKKVDEQIFFRLVQYFSVGLFECNEAEDFSPAKTLMNMCFTFYHETQQPGGLRYKHFLYSCLKEQPIWRSLRFWNAAFFDAVQCERARKPVCTRNDGRSERTEDGEFQENITFGQLGTFTCNMKAFGLNKDLCLEFLRKQCTIAELKEEQVQMLKDNVERWKEA